MYTSTYNEMKIFYNVLDESQCKALVHYSSSKLSLSKNRNIDAFPWHENDTVSYRDADFFIKDLLDRARHAIGQRVCLYASEPVYPHYTDLVMWVKGRKMDLHVDNGTGADDPRDGYLKNRHYSCILYLNDDFTGGETFFESGYKTKPTTGSLVVFPAGMKHGVKEVTSGTRFTLAMWFTRYFNQME
jgi:predicted 2-oxoglutarate/Fe(II)-dependent dioxygenase YbiX